MPRRFFQQVIRVPLQTVLTPSRGKYIHDGAVEAALSAVT